MNYVLGGASIGAVLGRAQGAAAVPWWLAGGAPTPVAVYQPKGAASLAASYVNLANPGAHDAAPGVAPSFNTDTGWTFISGQYLTTGITPTNNQQWGMIVRFSDPTWGAFTPLVGTLTAAGAIFILSGTTTTRAYYNGGVLQPGGANPGTSGTLALAGNRAFWNGSAETGTITTASGSITHQVYLGTINNAGAAYPSGTKKIQAIAIWDKSTNAATWMPAISAAVALI